MADITNQLQAAAGATVGPDIDPNFNQTVLLLHGDGTNGAQNNTFLDSSTNNFTITRNGNTTQGTFSPFSAEAGKWGNWFNGSSGNLSIAASTQFGFGTGDFTIECWISPNTVGKTQVIIDTRTSNPQVALQIYLVDNSLRLFVNGSDRINATSAVVAGAWQHIAYVRNSGTGQFYVNGTAVGSAYSDNNNYLSSVPVRIGTYFGADNVFFDGFISNVRIVKGTAVYTSAFTPSTTPLTAITNTSLLTCQSSLFVDNSTNAFAITPNGGVRVNPFSPFAPSAAYDPAVNGGSGYFDGSGDYLLFPNNAAFAFGTGAFTIEFWINAPLNNDKFILGGRAAIGTMHITTGGFSSTAGVLRYVGSSTIVSSNVITDNSWHHCAIVRGGSNNITLYVDGISVGTGTDATNYSATSGTWVIGANDNNYPNGLSGNQLTGYLSNLRIVKGTAVYTAAFTPPTAPLTPITNTSLLLNSTNAGIFDNTGKNNLETVGDAQIDTGTKKYGTGSMKFDGTGDYLLLSSNENFVFSSGDFTIEFWLYVNSGLNADISYYDGRPTNTTGAYNFIFSNNTGKLVYNASGSNRITGTTTLSTSTWYHVAVSRSGTSTKLFLNGTQEGSTYTDSNSYIIGANRPVIAASGFSLGSLPLNGYLDDLRITKGVARYTANFTLPTKEFPDL